MKSVLAVVAAAGVAMLMGCEGQSMHYKDKDGCGGDDCCQMGKGGEAKMHGGMHEKMHDGKAHGMTGGEAGAMVAKHENMWDGVQSAVAVLVPKSGSSVSGWVRFEDVENGVQVSGEVSGLEASSTHAMHVHMFGDATDAKGDAAGAHYNPEHKHHGAPDATEHHAGDLGNITADAGGKATFSYTVKGISVAGLKNPLVGRGVVIHAGVDDLKTDPTGNAGGRIAVGAIGVTQSVYPGRAPVSPSSPPAP